MGNEMFKEVSKSIVNGMNKNNAIVMLCEDYEREKKRADTNKKALLVSDKKLERAEELIAFKDSQLKMLRDDGCYCECIVSGEEFVVNKRAERAESENNQMNRVIAKLQTEKDEYHVKWNKAEGRASDFFLGLKEAEAKLKKVREIGVEFARHYPNVHAPSYVDNMLREIGYKIVGNEVKSLGDDDK